MSLIQDQLKKSPGLVAYMMAGDGGFGHSLAIMNAYAECGVSVIEVGVPFSDPIADGPTIQAAASRSLECGFTFKDTLTLIQAFKKNHATPVVLFSYLNPLLAQGILNDTLRDVKAAGADGCLIVDLPLEAADEYCEACGQHNLDPVFLIAQSTPESRIEALANVSRGMVYYVCRQGVTGVRNALPDDVAMRVSNIRRVTHCPVVVGFGISTPGMVSACCEVAQGAVVGSYLVDLAQQASLDTLCQQLTGLVAATQKRL